MISGQGSLLLPSANLPVFSGEVVRTCQGFSLSVNLPHAFGGKNWTLPEGRAFFSLVQHKPVTNVTACKAQPLPEVRAQPAQRECRVLGYQGLSGAGVVCDKGTRTQGRHGNCTPPNSLPLEPVLDLRV